jgi:CheY-like chemotaxis protein
MSPLHTPLSFSPPVLVVDDEPAILVMLQDALQGENFVVRTALNGKAALSLIHQAPVALVLTDLMMPLLSGIELAHQLRANPLTAAIPVLLMSATLPLYVDDVFAASIRKPFSLDDIVAKVRQFHPG